MYSQPNRNFSIRLIILLIACILFLLQLWYFGPYTIDDAFISYRYAQHLAQGHGFTWNPGCAPVEGFTNFLWVVVLSCFFIVTADLVVTSKILSAVAGIITIFLLERSSRTISQSNSALTAIPSLIFSLAPFTAFHSAEGLETTFYTMLISLVVYAALRIQETESSKWVHLLYSGIFLSGLTRPEGILFGAAIIISIIFSSNRYRLPLHSSLRSFTVFFILGVIYFIWRWKYFGYLFPNPFYIKHGFSLYHSNGAEYVGWFLLIYALVPFIIFFSNIFRKNFSRKVYVIIAPILLILIFYLGVDPIMGTAHRYLMPLFPVVLLLIVPRSLGEQRSSSIIISAGCFLTIVIIFIATFSDLKKEAIEYTRGMNSAHIKLGKLLHSIYSKPESRLLVCGDAGAIPYYSGFRTIDLIGLNNPSLVHDGFSSDYIFNQQPDVLALYSKNGYEVSADLGNGNDGRLALSPRMKEYEHVGSLFFNRNYYLIVFVRSGKTEGKELRKVLNTSEQP